MKLKELIVTVMLKQDLHFTQSHERIGRLISHAMLHQGELKEWHQKKEYKHYVFNNLYPCEKGGIYQKGKVYVFRLRSFYSTFLQQLRSLLRKGDETFHTLSTEIIEIYERPIEKLYSLSPIIVTVDGKPWTEKRDVLLLEKRLQDNAEKKYQALTHEKLASPSSFIQRIQLLSKTPYTYEYKGIRLLGSKVEIYIHPDETSQKLARMAMGSGLGEKNSSLGAGYCIPTYYA